jgi:hypothetical protein
MIGKKTHGPATGGATGGRIQFDAVRVTVVALTCAAVLYTGPAQAALFDPIMDILDEATLSFEQVVGGFILLVGLCGAWLVGMKNIGGGIMMAVGVLAFAAMVANNETIATEIGFSGG